MRKLLILMVAVFTLTATNAKAQDVDNVDLTVILQDVLDINVTAGSAISFTFDTPAEWTGGIDGDTPGDGGVTTFTCDATQDWDVTIDAPDLTGVVNAGTMLADNIGLWVEANGNNTIGTEVSCAYVSYAAPMALPNAATMLIENLGGNAGNAADNAFTIHWEVGTMQGPMNGTNMLDHVANGDFVIDTYTTTVNLTLQAD